MSACLDFRCKGLERPGVSPFCSEECAAKWTPAGVRYLRELRGETLKGADEYQRFIDDLMWAPIERERA